MKMKTNNLISKLFNPDPPLPLPGHFEAYFVQAYFVQTFILGKFPQGLGIVLAFVLHSAANTFYQYA